MPRVPPDSLVAELDLSSPLVLIDLLRKLIDIGVEEAYLTLEPCILEVEVDGETYPITYGEPSIIIASNASVEKPPGFRRIVKPAWCDYVSIETMLLLHYLTRFQSRSSYDSDSFRVLFQEDGVECARPVVTESLKLKYSWRAHVYEIDYAKLSAYLRIEERSGRWILLACLDGEVKPLVWAMRDGEKWILGISGFSDVLTPVVLRVYLDFILFITSGSRRDLVGDHLDQ